MTATGATTIAAAFTLSPAAGDAIKIHYIPKHGSWLNQAEVEISLFSRQCLGHRRLGAGPRFDVASVKPSNGAMVPGDWAGVRPLPGGRFQSREAALSWIVQAACNVQPYQLVGGDAAALSQHYDIRGPRRPFRQHRSGRVDAARLDRGPL